jgi:hypothetical protein
MSRAWYRVKLGIVGATFSVCAAAVFIRPLPPRRAPEPKPQLLYGIVMQELEAVREADYSRAYRQVSLTTQERFNVDDFADHVRTDHPEIARFERVEFGAPRFQGRKALVPVYVFLPSGEIAAVSYTLIREEGTWRIDERRVERRWTSGHRVGGERT